MTPKYTLTLVFLVLVTGATHALAQPGLSQPGPEPSGQEPSGPEEAPAPPRAKAGGYNSTEMIGGIFGVGLAGGEPAIGGAVRAITVRWDRVAWTVFDGFGTAGVSDFDRIDENNECSPLVEDCTLSAETGLAFFGTRLYYKVDRGATGRRQLWYGLGVGVIAEDSKVGNQPDGDSSARFSLSPSVDYVYQWNDGLSVGLGARVAVGVGERLSTGRIPLMMLVGIEFGITPFAALRKQITADLAQSAE